MLWNKLSTVMAQLHSARRQGHGEIQNRRGDTPWRQADLDQFRGGGGRLEPRTLLASYTKPLRRAAPKAAGPSATPTVRG
jgi:hypothetical protein